MNFEKQINKIILFNPSASKLYESDNGYFCYYGVLLKDGNIDTTKFNSGVINYNKLCNDEHVLCFKKVYSKDLDRFFPFLTY